MVNYKTIPVLRFNGFTDNWVKKRLGDIAIITTGNTPSTSVSDYYNGSRLFVSPADIQENRYVSKTKTTLTELGFEQGRKISKGSILFVCIGSTIGKVGQASEDCLTNQQINSLEALKEVSNDFIYGLLEKYGKKIKLLAGVQAVPQINKTDFSNFKYYLPCFPEQQKIASFLSAIDEKIQQLTRKKELLEQYKKGVMQQLFSGKLRFRDENGKAYLEWEEKRLEDICSFYSGGTPQSTNKKYYSGTIPFIGSGNIYDADVTTFISQEALENSSAKLVEKGDLLFALYGANSGEVAISKISGAINQAILCIRTNENTSYLYYLLFHNQGRIVSKYLQGGQGNLSAEIVRKLKYKFPSLKEQLKIASFLSSLDAKIESVATQIAQSQTFKKGLLQQMFV